jgi:hypothetical protein
MHDTYNELTHLTLQSIYQLIPHSISSNATANLPFIELVKPSTPHNTNRQEENSVVDPMDPQAKDRFVARLTEFQQEFDDDARAAANVSRIATGARDATEAAIAGVACNKTLSVANVVAIARVAVDSRNALEAAKRKDLEKGDSLTAISTTITQPAPSNLNSPNETAHSTQPSEESMTVPAQPPIVTAEPSTIKVTKAATNDDFYSNSTRETPPRARRSKGHSRKRNNSPEPDSTPGLFLGLTISAVLGAIFLKNDDEELFTALLVFVPTILVPYCLLSDRLFRFCIAFYVACVLLFLVAGMCVLRSL